MKERPGWLLVLAVLQFGISIKVNALNLNDFLPDFMTTNKTVESKNADPKIAFSIPETSKKRNTNNNINNGWYCNQIYDPSCTKNISAKVVVPKSTRIESSDNVTTSIYTANQGANEQYFNRNSNNYDSNAVANFNITNSNQSTLQAYTPKLNNYSPEDTLKNTVAIPFKPNNNTSVNVGANQVQFNVSY